MASLQRDDPIVVPVSLCSTLMRQDRHPGALRNGRPQFCGHERAEHSAEGDKARVSHSSTRLFIKGGLCVLGGGGLSVFHQKLGHLLTLARRRKLNYGT